MLPPAQNQAVTTGSGPLTPTSWRFGMAPTRTSPLVSVALQSPRAWHVARRLAHAPTPALAADIDRVGPRAWIDKQLDPSAVPDDVCKQVLAAYFPWEGYTTARLASVTNGTPRLGAPHLVRAIHARQLFTRRVLQESMVEFFSDLLYVSAASSKCSSYMLEYDWKVIRSHALGRFSDMLQASMTHPAMLLWLDNATSTAGAVNENLGRELLELHTVGVGNYTEADVKDSARILTGHGVDRVKLDYVFTPSKHATGAVQVMGFTHPNALATDGPAVLAAYLRYLALHPATARRIARRLAVRFVSDAPSDALVDQLAQVYLANGSDIKPVLRALFAHPEFDSSTGQKVRRPSEYLTSMLRNSDVSPTIHLDDPTWKSQPGANLGGSMWLLEAGGHVPRHWPVVNGYPDVAGAWLGTNRTRAMWNAASAVAGKWDQDLTLRSTYGLYAGQNVYTAAKQLTLRLTGYYWAAKDITTIASWLVGGRGTTVPATSVTLTAAHVSASKEAVRLVLASPYMLVR